MKKKVLLVRLDAIGDYILFRNVLSFIRESKDYRDVHLTVLGNSAWKSLAATYDKSYADEWIWVEKRADLFRKGYENLLPKCIWRHRVEKAQAVLRERLKARKYDEVLSLQTSRDPLLDEFVTGLAPSVVGVDIPGGNNASYTKLLDAGKEPFAFLQNRHAASSLTGETCNVPLSFPIRERTRCPANLMLFIGASHWTRRWPIDHFATLGRMYLETKCGDLYLAGGPHDGNRLKKLAKAMDDSSRVHILDGKRSLSHFVEDVANAKALIGNDTMAVHAAAALGVPCVIIANGISGKGGFWPYPDDLTTAPVRVVCADSKTVKVPLLPSLVKIQWTEWKNLKSVSPIAVYDALMDVLR